MRDKVNIHRIIKRTKVEGFGNRYCIWFQGCSIHCPDCANQNMWSSEGGKVLEISQVIEDIKRQKNIEGVTLLGGEPLDQIEATIEIIKEAKKMNLSTIVFTGYIFEDLLHKKGSIFNGVLQYTDLLIDGPFRKEMLDYSRPWVGSKNQRYIFLSERYKSNELKEEPCKNKYEIRIQKDGMLSLNGMGDIEKLKKIMHFK